MKGQKFEKEPSAFLNSLDLFIDNIVKHSSFSIDSLSTVLEIPAKKLSSLELLNSKEIAKILDFESALFTL